MAAPTDQERSTYGHMQARLIALLLQHDQGRFAHYIGVQQHGETSDDHIRPYRDLGVVFTLGTSLLDDIVPRIIRRLSFESPRSVVIEEPPARGRIHWERTLDATWAERPGEPPLHLHTRQRRRDFATPENLLAVATLVEYEHAIRQILRGDSAIVGANAMRHPLNDLADRTRRTLAFPQFAGLVRQVQSLIDNGKIAALEGQVANHNAPGSNRAYQDLLAWRNRWRTLNLLHRAPEQQPNDVLGANPERDNYLYQLWMFYELVELLHSQGRLQRISGTTARADGMAAVFTWGNGDEQRTYELRHDQAIDEPVGQWHGAPNPRDVPGVRPDFVIRRIEPAPAELRDRDGTLLWREGAVIWDAKYYRQRASDRTPSPPIKRMISDLALVGERYGVLLFAFRNEAQADSDSSIQHIAPAPHNQVTPPQEIAIRQVRPALERGERTLHQLFGELLNDAHDRLKQPAVLACHGVFLDAASIGTKALATSAGTPIASQTNDILVCPKPHIGPWRIDIVSRSEHCCNDPRFCHIAGQPGASPPVRPPRTAEELLQELEHIFKRSGNDDLNDEQVAAIAAQIESITRQFAELTGEINKLDTYYRDLEYMGLDVLGQLGKQEQISLALGVFLRNQLDSINANDYSAPVIHLSSVMEIEIKRRVFRCPGLVGDIANPKRQTLGALPGMRRYKEQTKGDWERIEAFVRTHWNEHVDSNDPGFTLSFDTFVTKGLDPLSHYRNKAAHTSAVSPEEYRNVQRLMFQGGKLGYSALNALINAWTTTDVDAAAP